MLRPDFSTSISAFFKEQVGTALDSRKVKATPLVEGYLVQLLEHYAFTNNLYSEDEPSGKKRNTTLAELYLKACSSEPPIRNETLKRLADTSLYISGFFGDSLNRKVVDIDYYAGMGGAAYANLASLTEEGELSRVYRDFALRFMDFVDVLTHISQQALIQTNSDLLRLYDRYVSTGSKLAEEQLIQKGILHVGQTPTKNQKQ